MAAPREGRHGVIAERVETSLGELHPDVREVAGSILNLFLSAEVERAALTEDDAPALAPDPPPPSSEQAA